MGLVGDSDPVIRAFFEALAAPLEAYRSEIALGETNEDREHPFLARNTGPAAVVGCWSVRLRRHGFHVNHTHPLGWISSAFYIAVPDEADDEEKKSGWLKLGEPLHRMPFGEARRFIKPRPGLLVLFPSYLWHGTMPIHGDQTRLTIAFDAIPTTPAAPVGRDP